MNALAKDDSALRSTKSTTRRTLWRQPETGRESGAQEGTRRASQPAARLAVIFRCQPKDMSGRRNHPNSLDVPRFQSASSSIRRGPRPRTPSWLGLLSRSLARDDACFFRGRSDTVAALEFRSIFSRDQSVVRISDTRTPRLVAGAHPFSGE